MFKSRRISLAFGATCLSLAFGAICLSLAMLASTAAAASPATVTIRVEGVSETKVSATQLTTTTTPVVKDGNSEDSCPGTSAAGALEIATGGNWGGHWYGGKVEGGSFQGLGYSVETIEGESYPFTGSTFWDLWINDKAEEQHGVCGAEVHSGDQILLFPCHYEEGKECPTPLGLEAPSSASAGAAIPVTVVKYASNGSSSPVPGATVSDGGASATTDPSGHATLTLAQSGSQTLSASATEAVRAEATVCVHNGNDGTCGTTLASSGTSTSASAAPAVAPVPYKGPFALVAVVKGLADGRSYRAGAGPRVLTGSIAAHGPVTSVSLRLRREYRGRCSAFDGVRERFRAARCGTGSFFRVSSAGGFSYLLPSALRPGRYVLDVLASDAAGDHTELARGSSRIVFYVR